jgi:hypothetical protein
MLENPCLTVFLTKMLLEDSTYRFPIAHSGSSKRFVLFLLAVLELFQIIVEDSGVSRTSFVSLIINFSNLAITGISRAIFF